VPERFEFRLAGSWVDVLNEAIDRIPEGSSVKDETAIEKEIQAKGLNAPRLTPADIDAQIRSEYCGRASSLFKVIGKHDPALDCLTICVLVLQNGFMVVGTSACASPENYDAALGHKIARESARQNVWELEGYRLRSKLAEGARS
jgi:Phage protein (N4 Gp49/phage Sf6 gene 66) family